MPIKVTAVNLHRAYKLNERYVQMRFRKIRLELNRFPVSAYRFTEFAFFLKGNAEIIMEFRNLRLKLNRSLVADNCILKQPLIMKRVTEIMICEKKFRIELNRFFV